MKKVFRILLLLLVVFITATGTERNEEYFNMEVREDKLLYKKEESKPYTGIVSVSEGDKIIKKQVYNEGKLNSEKGYHENGTIKWESTGYKDGKLDGISRIYYDSGQLKMETNYKDGEKDGMEKGYQKNGKIIAELNYKKDCLHGTSKFYDKNGNLEHEQNYKEYVLHGTEKIYENGKVILEREYKDGEIVSSKNISE